MYRTISKRIKSIDFSPSYLKNIRVRGSAFETRCSPVIDASVGVPQLIRDLVSQPAGDRSHKPGGRLPLLIAWSRLPSSRRALPVFGCWFLIRLFGDRGTWM